MFSPKPILLHLPTSQKTKSKKSNENLETITLKRYCSTKYFIYLFMRSPVNFGNHSTHMKLKISNSPRMWITLRTWSSWFPVKARDESGLETLSGLWQNRSLC